MPAVSGKTNSPYPECSSSVQSPCLTKPFLCSPMNLSSSSWLRASEPWEALRLTRCPRSLHGKRLRFHISRARRLGGGRALGRLPATGLKGRGYEIKATAPDKQQTRRTFGHCNVTVQIIRVSCGAQMVSCSTHACTNFTLVNKDTEVPSAKVQRVLQNRFSVVQIAGLFSAPVRDVGPEPPLQVRSSMAGGRSWRSSEAQNCEMC